MEEALRIRREEIINKMSIDMASMSQEQLATRVVSLLIYDEGNLNKYKATIEMVLEAHRRCIMIHQMGKDRLQHRKGGTYTLVVPFGQVQTDVPLVDYDGVSVYRSEQDGSWWIRRASEMEDGRFTVLSKPPALAGGDRFTNTINGWNCAVVEEKEGQVAFKYDNHKDPHYLGRAEFDKRFKPEEGSGNGAE